MVHVQTILKGFEAETVVHKQRVGSATENSKTLITGPRNWHIHFENNGHYAFTGISHLELLHIFLLVDLCITLCWRFGTGAAASLCVTPRGVRLFWGL